eukprot:12701284-Alexandrium_andersonii.AAC.1
MNLVVKSWQTLGETCVLSASGSRSPLSLSACRYLQAQLRAAPIAVAERYALPNRTTQRARAFFVR